MLALVTTPEGKAPVEIRQVPDPQPAPNQALIAVRAFSLNRGELHLNVPAHGLAVVVIKK